MIVLLIYRDPLERKVLQDTRDRLDLLAYLANVVLLEKQVQRVAEETQVYLALKARKENKEKEALKE